eukprot:12230360-Prorocentrum_lima.AAC.1
MPVEASGARGLRFRCCPWAFFCVACRAFGWPAPLPLALLLLPLPTALVGVFGSAGDACSRPG